MEKEWGTLERLEREGVNYLNTVLIYENLKNKLNIEKIKIATIF